MTVRKLTFAALAALILLAAPSAARGDIVFDGRWESAGPNNWDSVLNLKPGNRNKLTYVTAPRRRDWGYAADLRVGGNRKSERIEFLEANLFSAAEGKDHWWAWSLRIPSDSMLPSTVFVMQINSEFNGRYCSIPRGGASNSLRLINPVAGRRADRWYWTVTGGNGNCRIRQIRIKRLRVVKERWIDWLCRFRWSSTRQGLSKCYYRVQPRRAWRLAFRDRGPNLVRSPAADGNLRVEQGLYKAEARPYVHLIQGGVVVADTRAEAAHAAFAPGTKPPAASTGHGTSPALWVLIATLGALAAWLLARVRPRAPMRSARR